MGRAFALQLAVKRKERPRAEKATCCCDRQACRYGDDFPSPPAG